MVDPGLIIAGVTELLKIGIQYQIAKARTAGLSEEQIMAVLEGERERFKSNIAEPLREV